MKINFKKIFLFVLLISLIVVLCVIRKIPSTHTNPTSNETVDVMNEESYILSDDSNFRKKSVKDWKNLALDFYEKSYGYRPSYAECYYVQDNLVINLYDVFNDHRSSCEWYEIDKNTGIITNILSEEVDFNKEQI